MKDTRETTKDIRITIGIFDKSSSRTISDTIRMTWYTKVGLEEILDHVIDAIEKIDV